MIGEEGNERKEEVGEEVKVVQSHSFMFGVCVLSF